MTRILCLHGYGTSSNILKHQLSALTAAADPSFEFVFLEGEVECQKARGKYILKNTEELLNCREPLANASPFQG